MSQKRKLFFFVCLFWVFLFVFRKESFEKQIRWRFTDYGPTHQNKIQFPPQSVSPIRKLPWASYPSPSEGRQNENHNNRKLIKLITWTTALSNSMKLWAMPCRVTQDGWVTVESSDKMWFTGEGNGNQLRYSCLANPMNSMMGDQVIALWEG